MGTPAAVATIIDGDAGWIGRYVNSDGYPDGLGVDLFKAYHTAFNGDAQAMIRKLVLEPQNDWSALSGTNMALEPGWVDDNWKRPAAERIPLNYFHRGEGTSPRLETGDDFGRYLYFIGDDGMNVYVKYNDDFYDVPAYTFIPWETPVDDAVQILTELNERINASY